MIAISIQLIDTFDQNVGGWSYIEDEEMGRRKFLTAAAAAAQKRVVLGDPG